MDLWWPQVRKLELVPTQKKHQWCQFMSFLVWVTNNCSIYKDCKETKLTIQKLSKSIYIPYPRPITENYSNVVFEDSEISRIWDQTSVGWKKTRTVTVCFSRWILFFETFADPCSMRFIMTRTGFPTKTIPKLLDSSLLSEKINQIKANLKNDSRLWTLKITINNHQHHKQNIKTLAGF